jgi:hypothetical protein
VVPRPLCLPAAAAASARQAELAAAGSTDLDTTFAARDIADINARKASGELTGAHISAPAATVAAPAAAAAVAAAATTGAGGKLDVQIQEEAAEAAVTTVVIAEEQLKIAEDQYQSTSDVLTLLKKGIRFENGWMNGPLKQMLDGVVLKNVETALLEFAMLTDMVEDDSIYDMIATEGIGGALGAYGTVRATEATDEYNARNKGNFASGGYTGDGPAMQPAGVVHKGEYVIPRGGALVSGGGGKTVHVGSVTVNIQTNDPNKVKQVIDEVFNAGHILFMTFLPYEILHHLLSYTC